MKKILIVGCLSGLLLTSVLAFSCHALADPSKGYMESVISVPWDAIESDDQYTLRQLVTFIETYLTNPEIEWTTIEDGIEAMEVTYEVHQRGLVYTQQAIVVFGPDQRYMDAIEVRRVIMNGRDYSTQQALDLLLAWAEAIKKVGI